MSDDQINKWNIRHAQLILALILLTLLTKRMELLSLGAIISFSSLLHRASKSLAKMKPPGGYANWVTGFRFVLILIGSFLFGVVSKYVILVIMLLAVLLDGVDGFLARKYRESSTFGSLFDVEVDAFFVLLMCFYYYQYEGIEWWILIPGVLRYLSQILVTLLPKPTFKEKKRNYTTIIAVIFFMVLCSGIIMEGTLKYYTLMTGAVLVFFSFSISTAEYIRYSKSV